MTRLSMNELTTYRWSFEQDSEAYAAAGYSAIGVWRQKLADFGEQRGAALLEDLGLATSSFGWIGGFTGSDGRSFDESVDDAREALQVAAELRAGCVLVYGGGGGGHTPRHARRLLRQALDTLLPLAEDLHLTLAIEPMHEGVASEWTFVTELDDALKFLAAYRHPRLKLALDTYHVAHDTNILDRLPAIVDQLALVQLGDADATPRGEQSRLPLGDGRLPLREIVSTLLSAGYEGDFDVELLGEAIEALNYEKLLAQSQRSFAQWSTRAPARQAGAVGSSARAAE